MSILLDTNDLSNIVSLNVGDKVLLSGVIYSARDSAHKRLFELSDNGGELPFALENAVIYYMGPTPTKKGDIIGSCGPTTSGRMDKFSPRLISLGLKIMIGKGERSNEVINSCKEYKSVYLCAIGGAGALIASCVTSCDVIAFEDLGCESIKKLTVKDFPLIVGIDCNGRNIFEEGKNKYKNL